MLTDMLSASITIGLLLLAIFYFSYRLADVSFSKCRLCQRLVKLGNVCSYCSAKKESFDLRARYDGQPQCETEMPNLVPEWGMKTYITERNLEQALHPYPADYWAYRGGNGKLPPYYLAYPDKYNYLLS